MGERPILGLMERWRSSLLPAVSVIIPTYNRWPMIGEAVQSVLAQTFKDFELIVVDDGSDDATTLELRRLGIQVLARERGGVAAARNAGAAAARGRYLAFLDSDDYWLPRKLAVQVAFMTERETAEICQTDEIWIRNGIRVNPKRKHGKPSGDIFERSIELCLVSPSAVMMTRRLFLDLGGFDEALPVCEDYDLWLRIAVQRPVLLIPEALVVKRGGHADQLSRSVWGMDRFRVIALTKLLRSDIGAAQRQLVLAGLRRKIAVLARGARRRGKSDEASAYEALYDDCAARNPECGDDCRSN